MSYFDEKLKEVQNTFSELFSDTMHRHFSYYAFWKKYPRKIKKKMKRTPLWECIMQINKDGKIPDCHLYFESKIPKYSNEFIEINGIVFNEEKIQELREGISKITSIPMEYLRGY